MITLNIKLPEEVKERALRFQEFRVRCKNYLAGKGIVHDKFTVVSHDSYIGYISEWLIYEYVKKEFKETLKDCRIWEQDFDMPRIENIISQNSTKDDDVAYVKKYFYDNWDMFISTENGSYNCDIKTALTKKAPALNWNFLYPVVQAERAGKDLMILVYYIYEGEDVHNLKDEILVGATTYDLIRGCKVIRKGETTRFGTKSQIDNYITELSRDYSNLTNFF